MNLQLLIDSIPALIHSGLPDGYLDFFNRRWLNYVGLSLEDLLGWKWTATIHPEDVAAMVEKWRSALTTGEPFEHEARVRRADGEYHWMVHHKVSLRDERGNIVKWYGSSIDIEDRKRAQDALGQSDRCYRELISRVNESLWRVALEQPIPIDLPVEESLERLLQYGYIAECSEVYARNMGFSRPEEVLGKRLADLVPSSEEERIEIFRASARGGWRALTTEFRGRGIDGNLKHFLRTEIPIVENGMLVSAWGMTRDLTELRQAEESQRESEERFRTIFENAGLGTSLVDRQGHPIKCNPAIQKMLGYTEEELRRMSFTDVTHPDDLDLDSRLYGELTAGKRDKYEVEKRYIKKDGRIMWGHLTVSLVRDRYGAPAPYIFEIVEDITERKRAESAIRESEERFRKVFEEGPFSMCIVGLDRRLLRVNEALCALLGHTADELTGRAFSDIMHPDDIGEEADLTKQVFAGVMSKFRVEQRLLKKNGQILWVNLTATVIRARDGQPPYGLAMVENITERVRAEEELRRSEDRLRLIIDTIPTMAWSLGPDGAVDFVNQRWMDYTGLSLEEELEDPTRAVHPEDLPGVMEKWLRAMAAGEPSEDELRLRRADGEYRWFLVRTVPLRDEMGNIVKWYGSSIDIEDRKRAEKELYRSFEQLRALTARLQRVREEERAKVAREIHDELGQALTAIKVDLASLIYELSPKQEQQSRREESIMTLIDETIQSVRRISTELRPGILDDLGLVAAIEWAAEEFEARTGTKCRLELPHDDIVIDQERATALFRIFQETLTNVARHANASQVDVRLAGARGSLILEIHDNGKGIGAEQLSAGSSLGILGMRERALLLGGEFAISGARGQGTTVSVRIPEARQTQREQGK
jgi:PAS domain S-box-containing protein